MGERLVVIGGDAGGMGAATQARRLRSDLDIVALERGRHTSYSACGIPYVVGGEVGSLDDLVVRTPERLRADSRIDVRIRHEAMAVDLAARRVEVRDHEHKRTFSLPFDQLLFGTGARPRRPDVPGVDLPFVRGVQTLDDGQALLDLIHTGVRRLVVVGGGYIGLEMAEAFVRRGASVTVLERSGEVMGTLDADMGALVSGAMRRHGIEVRTSTQVLGFEPGMVQTSNGEVAADLVILGTGVQPNSQLAEDAGLELGAGRAIAVNRRQQASAEGTWAAGDCAESFHLVRGRHVHVALGTVANKQARVAGINLGGGYATFPGVVGTAVSKICATEVARTGLTVAEAERDGFAVDTVTIDATTRAGYYPGAAAITVKLVAERRSGRVLGAQLVGEEGAAKRIDVVATALHAGMTVEQLTALDLSYAPAFSPVWDPILVAARALAGSVSR
jgi:NADPH-dependent 2,4-dienoyl-CoA reductase/sulfur reductase-like enzyme